MTPRSIAFYVAFILISSAGFAAAPPTPIIKEQQTFDLLMFGSPVGRMVAQDLAVTEENEQRTGTRMIVEMTLNRMGASASVGMNHFEIYHPDGRLAHFRTELNTAMMPQITVGKVVGDVCQIQTNGRQMQIPFDRDAVSERQLEEDFKKLVQDGVGAKFSSKVFVPDLMKTVPTTTTLTRIENRQTHFGEKQLFCVETAMNVGTVVKSHSWVDSDGDVYEQETALGPITLQAVRVSGDAPKPVISDMAPDVFEKMILRPDKQLGNPLRIHDAQFKLRFTQAPSGPIRQATFYSDDSQKVLPAGRDAVVLHITSAAPAGGVPLSSVTAPPVDGEKYLKPTSLVQSDDPQIVSIAQEIRKKNTDAWALSKALEKWVNNHLTEKSLNVAFASAKETLETREGDCTEHATLLVALLRAAGLPARAAEGLVYAQSIGGFGYHMWTEVYLNGRWYDLDATRPGALTDATHIQMGASAMDESTAVDLSTQILKYLGQFQIEVEKAG